MAHILDIVQLVEPCHLHAVLAINCMLVAPEIV